MGLWAKKLGGVFLDLGKVNDSGWINVKDADALRYGIRLCQTPLFGKKIRDLFEWYKFIFVIREQDLVRGCKAAVCVERGGPICH